MLCETTATRPEPWWWSVAGSGPGLTWTADTLTAAFRDAPKRAAQYLSKTTVYYSLRTENYAKAKARWTDRTGNARSGLSSSYQIESSATRGTYTIDLFHRVPYGIWLEVRFNMKYAIINKSVSAEGQKFFNAANKLMAAMFEGK